MVKILSGVFVAILLVNVSSTVFAAQGALQGHPSVLQTKQSGELRPLKLQPDLTCVITGSLEKEGSKPFKNGAVLMNGGVTPSEWIRVVVQNQGVAAAKQFQVSISVSGANPTNPILYDITQLNANQSIPYVIQVFTPGTTHHVGVTVKVDAAGKVDESNRSNNNAVFYYTVNNVK